MIRRAVRALPDVEEGTSYRTPAWRHRGRLLARLHQDGESIVLKVGNETRDHLLQADPRTFFITDHYLGYPMVLARLDRLSACGNCYSLSAWSDWRTKNRVSPRP